MKTFVKNNSALVIGGALVLIAVLYSVLWSPSVQPPAGVDIFVADAKDNPLSKADSHHLTTLLPIVWRRSSDSSRTLFEVDITPSAVEIERCHYGDRTIIRRRIDLDITITNEGSSAITDEQTFQGSEPEGCPDTVSDADFPPFMGDAAFSLFSKTRDFDGSLANPAQIEQWLFQTLGGQSGLPALKPADTERAGVEVVTFDNGVLDSTPTLDDFTRRVPDAWKAPGGQRPRYEVQITATFTSIESCQYSLGGSDSTLAKTDRLRNDVTVTILDLNTFEPAVDPQPFNGSEPPGCSQRKSVKIGEDFYSTLTGDPPDASDFERWLKTVTPQLTLPGLS